MKRKFIAPIVISAIIVLSAIAYTCLVIFLNIAIIIKVIMSAFYLLVAGVMIYVLIERIKEIRSGEEDDISKY